MLQRMLTTTVKLLFRRVFFLTLSYGPQTPLVAYVFYLVLLCTCVWLKVNRYTFFWHFPYCNYFLSMQTNWRYTDSGLPEPKTNKALLPARLFLPVPPSEHVPFWKGPALEEGTPRVSGEPSRRKNSAHTSPEGPGLRSPARGAPP